MSIRTLRATSLIETLVACLILAIAVVGTMKIFQVNYNLAKEARYAGVTSQISRGEIERAKVWGYRNFPVGTFVLGNPNIGTWAGAFDATANSGAGGWTTSGVTYYDIYGAQTTAGSATSRFSVADTMLDAGASPSYQVIQRAAYYTLDDFATRTFTVSVSDSITGGVLLTSGTVLVMGGL